MSLLKTLKRDERGVAVIEIAIVLPVLILFIWGIFQVGILYQANAGMQHALGQGARHATLCLSPDPCENPTAAAVKSEIEAAVFGTEPGTFAVPTPTTDSSGRMTLTVNYTQPMNFLFFPGPTVNLTRSKVVYLAPTS
ncbi:MAG TPA: TadE/TadG family type IV pilus assembly protein [Sphingomicrobium sp.]|nr:TadE/TadG family type IV pilus assembly protein [Sphingomicrobium sp.]